MTVTELPNGRIEKRSEPETLRYIFFGPVEKKAFNYYEYFDFTGVVVKLTPAEYDSIQRQSADIPVRLSDCRFIYRQKFFKTSLDTTDSDVVLGAIAEKERRKAARLAKLGEIGREVKKLNAERNTPHDIPDTAETSKKPRRRR